MVTTQTATDVAEALERHIRIEERILFPQIEKILGEEGLARLQLAARVGMRGEVLFKRPKVE